MNVAMGRAGSWSPVLWPSSALRSHFGEPTLQHPGRESPPLEKPTWPRPADLHPGVSLQASSPPSSHSSKTPWPCLPTQPPRGCVPPGPCFFSGHRSPQALTTTPCLPCSPTATCTCTCAGRTTPTCRARCTPRTAPPACSRAQVGRRLCGQAAGLLTGAGRTPPVRSGRGSPLTGAGRTSSLSWLCCSLARL